MSEKTGRIRFIRRYNKERECWEMVAEFVSNGFVVFLYDNTFGTPLIVHPKLLRETLEDAKEELTELAEKNGYTVI